MHRERERGRSCELEWPSPGQMCADMSAGQLETADHDWLSIKVKLSGRAPILLRRLASSPAALFPVSLAAESARPELASHRAGQRAAVCSLRESPVLPDSSSASANYKANRAWEGPTRVPATRADRLTVSARRPALTSVLAGWAHLAAGNLPPAQVSRSQRVRAAPEPKVAAGRPLPATSGRSGRRLDGRTLIAGSAGALFTL